MDQMKQETFFFNRISLKKSDRKMLKNVQIIFATNLSRKYFVCKDCDGATPYLSLELLHQAIDGPSLVFDW